MVQSTHLAPGSTIVIAKKIYRVESAMKVSVPRGQSFVKTKLRDLTTNKLVEKNFKLNQDVQEAALEERKLEFLYCEKDRYIFLDVQTLDEVSVSSTIMGKKMNYLKEGIEVKASFFSGQIFAVELPQYLELMVVDIIVPSRGRGTTGRVAQLETGAKIEVLPFIEVGDIVKIDTRSEEYIQRV